MGLSDKNYGRGSFTRCPDNEEGLIRRAGIPPPSIISLSPSHDG